jgi:large subunit ribosomal protein L19
MDVSSLVEAKKNPKIPDIAPGDTVRVSARIVEGGKERIQVFQGVVIKIKRGGNGAGFTVRHVAYGVGVERTFPFGSPLVEKVEIIRQGKVRRSRLYYLRGLSGKEARRKIKRVERKVREQVGEELLAAPPEEEYLEPEAVAEETATGEVAVEEKPEAKAKEPVADEKAKAVVEEAATGEKPEAVAEEAAEEAAAGEKPEVIAEEAVTEAKAEAVAEEPVSEEKSETTAEKTEDQDKET